MVAYFRPRTLEEALVLRAERPLLVLAGGTDVYPARTARIGWGDMRDPDILDISRIGSLRGIEETPTHFRFGALTTWSELRRADLPAAFTGYQAAAREIGGVQVQSRGTLVGNICTASPAGDSIPCLLTLDTEVEVASIAGRRVLSLPAFITGYRQTACRPDELVLAIRVPKPDKDARGAFLKLGARRYLVISIAMAAAVVSADADGTIRRAALAVGACGPVAMRLPELDRALLGQPLASAGDIVAPAHLAQLAPIDDVRGSAEYRRAAAFRIVRDILVELGSGVERKVA